MPQMTCMQCHPIRVDVTVQSGQYLVTVDRTSPLHQLSCRLQILLNESCFSFLALKMLWFHFCTYKPAAQVMGIIP